MEKVDVGEYVRTEKGLIAKYLGFEKEDSDVEYSDMEYSKHLFDNKIYWYYEYYNEYVYEEDWEQFKENIVNHSKQLIDLIEVGDIVEIRTGLHSSFKYFVENEDNLLLLEEQVKQFWNIKTILTKEQFEDNCYKVGGE